MDSHTRTASENSDSCRWPENSKWVAQVLTEMDQNIREMLKLIEENNESLTKHQEDDQSDSVSNVKEFNGIYQSLAERYNRLTRELQNGVQLSGSDHIASSPVTPKGLLDSLNSGRLTAVSVSSGSGSSDASPNVEDSDTSSESETEEAAFYSSLNHHVVSDEESSMKMRKQMNYRELMKKIEEYEEELRTANLKIRDSEQEIEKLKGEIELAEDLREELETARGEIEHRDAVIRTEERRVLELKGQVIGLESELSDSSLRIKNLESELNSSRECLEVSEVEISMLGEMLRDCKQSFSAEKEGMEADIACLLEKHALLDARVRELESQGELLEDQIKNSNAEKTEMRAKFQEKEAQWQADMNTLKADLETLNKEFDKRKLSYDMLGAEKDEVSAKVDNLKAELRSRGVEIEQMEERLNQLQRRQSELVSESETAKNVAEGLRARVEGLEREVERQRRAIAEGEEEKREAIRQLCFSLDHYRSGYRQLVRSLPGKYKRQAVIVV